MWGVYPHIIEVIQRSVKKCVRTVGRSRGALLGFGTTAECVMRSAGMPRALAVEVSAVVGCDNRKYRGGDARGNWS